MAKKVKTIPATLNPMTAEPLGSPVKRKTCGYARVSTSQEDQESSFEAQVDYYTNYIKSRDDWEFVNVYTDDGISATSTAKRKGFNTMIADALEGKIDLIITKSVSRFARNTVDSLSTIRKLKDVGCEVFFEKENIWTFDSRGELLISIMSSLSQEESRSISQNVLWGKRKRMADGKVEVPFGRFMGYDRGKDGNLVINEEQAKIIRRIYSLFLQGMTPYGIAKQLTSEGVKTPGGKDIWSGSTVKSILTNEKYRGDALLQKTYTVNTLEKKRVANNGLAPKYYVEGSHEAIIDRDVFLRVQAEIVRRANILTDGKKRVYSARYALSSIVVCGHCGDIYRRIKWNNRGCKSTVWRCVSRVLKKSSGIDCPARTIREEDLHAAVGTAINDAWSKRDSILPALKENIRSAIEGDSEAQIAEVDREIKERQAELLGAGNDQKKIDKIGDAIISLREERQVILADAAARQGLRDKVNDLVAFLDEQTMEITEYSETLVRRLIEKIIVYDEKLTVEFKSGLEIDVDA